jgi:hypothetical protein
MAKRTVKKTPDAPWENKKVPQAPFDNQSYGLIKLAKAITESIGSNTNITTKLLDYLKKQNKRKIEVNIPEIKIPESKSQPDTKLFANSMLGVADSIKENTRVTIGLVEYMKLQKEGKEPVVVNVPKVKPWEHIRFEVSRDNNNLMKYFDAKRIK